MIQLQSIDLALAAALVLLTAGLSWHMRLGVERGLLIGAVRTVVQLLLIGLVLDLLFQTRHLGWVGALACVMLAVAAYEVRARQHRPLAGAWGYGVGALAMFCSAFGVTALTLVVIIGPAPWYEPRYAIPLLGMMLGNTMTGVALALERLTQNATQQREVIEGRLLLGQPAAEAASDLRREAMRAGTMPVVNAMAAVGVVSLPGMMTGQILAGASPLDAVRYQVLIMFMIAACTVAATVIGVVLASRRLFDERERLRLDRLRPR